MFHRPQARALFQNTEKWVRMELDTGAAVSVMSADLYNKLEGEPLRQSRLRLKTYTGEIVSPKGIGMLSVVYKRQRLRLPTCGKRSLLGLSGEFSHLEM